MITLGSHKPCSLAMFPNPCFLIPNPCHPPEAA